MSRPTEARAIQDELRAAGDRLPARPTMCAWWPGVDISVGGRGRPGRAAVVVTRATRSSSRSSSRWSRAQVTFPYVPGLLSFREIPVLAPAFERLRLTARPRASWTARGSPIRGASGSPRTWACCSACRRLAAPSRRLIGSFEEPGEERARQPATATGDEVIGAVVRTRTRRQAAVHLGGPSDRAGRGRRLDPEADQGPAPAGADAPGAQGRGGRAVVKRK